MCVNVANKYHPLPAPNRAAILSLSQSTTDPPPSVGLCSSTIISATYRQNDQFRLSYPSPRHVLAVCPCCMSIHVFACPCCVSMSHVFAAYPCCMSMLHYARAACPCFMSMLPILYVYDAYPRCINMMQVLAANTGCMYMLHVHAACHCCTYMLNNLAVCTCCMPLLHVQAAQATGLR